MTLKMTKQLDQQIFPAGIFFFRLQNISYL